MLMDGSPLSPFALSMAGSNAFREGTKNSAEFTDRPSAVPAAINTLSPCVGRTAT